MSKTRVAARPLPGFIRTGALAGRNSVGGLVRDSYVTGGSVTGDQSAVAGNPINFVGCLLGYNAGTVRDSHAGCAATATGTEDSPTSRDQAGGLIGENAAITINSVQGAGTVRDSHATGAVTADRRAGGLAGSNTTIGHIATSYATGAVTVAGANGPRRRPAGPERFRRRCVLQLRHRRCPRQRQQRHRGRPGGESRRRRTTVNESYATGDVTASGAGVRNVPADQLGNLLGGLAGELTTGAQINASYATGDVTTTTAADTASWAAWWVG